ncbi:MAG TPA: DUF1573 domain-containing protein [Opitutaceae bacterium]|nr:DUF1573 domain-containing protein [Opitutaceae bacterium]
MSAAAQDAAAAAANPLVWDAAEKTIPVKPSDGAADFDFTVTNTSKQPVTIEQIRPTCGCTVAEMPATPWVIAPGAKGTFSGYVNFRGKEGTFSKSLFVNSSAGTQVLTVTIKIPQLDDAQRKRNQEIAQANREAVFHGDCASCHLQPAIGRTGAELFTAACGVCHFAANRASMVPDLLTARQRRDAEFWRKWISDGKEGTLMPAWSKAKGGPLTRGQIESLVQFAMQTLPTEPPPPTPPEAAAVPAPASAGR